MQDAEHVDHAQRLGDRAQVVQALIDAHRVAQPVAQIAAGNVFHREILMMRQRAEIVDLGDGAVRDAGDDLVFALEALRIVELARARCRGS